MSKSFGQGLLEKLIELTMPSTWSYYKVSPIYPRNIEGCSEAEIEEIRTKQEVERLPYIYLEYLRVLGKQSGDLHIGYDVSYFYLTSDNFRSLLNMSLGYFQLPHVKNHVFVFMNSQSHTFWFFYVDPLDDDPPVYYFAEGLVEYMDQSCKNGPIKLWEHLSIFLTQFIAERASKEDQEIFLDLYAPNWRKTQP